MKNRKKKKRNERTNKTDFSSSPSRSPVSLSRQSLSLLSLSLSLKLLCKTISFYLCGKSLYTLLSLSLYVSNLSQTGLLLTVDVPSSPSISSSIYGPAFSFFLNFEKKKGKGKEKKKTKISWLSPLVGWLKPTRTPSSTSPSCGHLAKW